MTLTLAGGFVYLSAKISGLSALVDQMKVSEIARYWAARSLTQIRRAGNRFRLTAPFASDQFTVRTAATGSSAPALEHNGKPIPLSEVNQRRDLKPGTWIREQDDVVICFDLPRGVVSLTV